MEINSSYEKLRSPKTNKKYKSNISSKTHSRQDNFEKSDENIDDSLGNSSTKNSSYNRLTSNSSSSIKRRELFKSREDDYSHNTQERPEFAGFYDQDGANFSTSRLEPLRERRFNLPSDPMAAREALREQYERARGITGEKTGDYFPERGNIKWSNNGSLDEGTETKLKSTINRVINQLPEDKRPKFSLEIKDKDPNKFAGGTTYPNKKRIELFAQNPTTGEKLDAKTVERNGVHELAHIVDAAMADEKYAKTKDPADRYHGLKDSQGRDLYSRARELELMAREKGFKPEEGKAFTMEAPSGLAEYRQNLMEKYNRGEISEKEAKLLDNRKIDELASKQNPNFIYDKYDPYVNSLNYKDKTGNGNEKYARMDKQEYFAETFTTYVLERDAFKEKMSQMEDYLKINKPGTDEYKYVKESLGIMKDSYLVD